MDFHLSTTLWIFFRFFVAFFVKTCYHVHEVVIMASFSDRFSQLVLESEKSITDIAKDLNVSKQTISAWCTGARSPRQPMVIYIARHFHVNIPWLVGVTDERIHTDFDNKEKSEPDNHQPDPLDRDLIELFSQLTDSEKKIITAQIRGILSSR